MSDFWSHLSVTAKIGYMERIMPEELAREVKNMYLAKTLQGFRKDFRFSRPPGEIYKSCKAYLKSKYQLEYYNIATSFGEFLSNMDELLCQAYSKDSVKKSLRVLPNLPSKEV